MNNFLAESILVKIMGWTQEQISEERPLIQALGKLKYDEYQQFSTGMRFTESLVNWLNQFETIEERNVAYKFIKSRLIFITSKQINHLIDICFNERIDEKLISKAAQAMMISPYLVKKIYASDFYKEVKRKALFLGLSDGAKIDQLRRYSHLDNEQVFSSYHISDEKMSDLLKELKSSCGEGSKFTSIFLIDDFTASGLSYIRLNEGKGKLYKFIESIYSHESTLENLIEHKDLDIHIIFYLATKKSISYLNDSITELKQKLGCDFNHSVSAVQVIEDSTSDNVKSEADFINIIKQDKYFDNAIIDTHYEKGRIVNPYLGFDECALPVVLNHNTPNNSLPILWFSSEMKKVGLFPRVTRHKE